MVDSILAIDNRANGEKNFLGISQSYNFEFKVGGPDKAGVLERINHPLNPLTHKIQVVDNSTNPPKVTDCRISEKDYKRLTELKAKGYDIHANPAMSKDVKGDVILDPK